LLVLEEYLAERTVLNDEFVRQLISVGEVDILVGVPTFNSAKTVGTVVSTIRAGLLKHFPRERAAIINADGGSKDGTSELVTAASITDLRRSPELYTLRTLHCISTVSGAGPATGPALRTIMAAAELLRAKACAVISPSSTNVEPGGIDQLLRPVYRDDFDFVAPTYRRHKFDGLLLRNLLYPVVRALYATRIREPYPSDFALSGRLCSHFLEREIWENEDSDPGTEISMVLLAIAGKFRLCQAFLGTKARVHRGSADLVPAMRQSVGPLFSSLDTNFQLWAGNGAFEPIPTFGAEYDLTSEPIRVNRRQLHQMFSSGVGELAPVLRSILSPQTLLEIQSIAKMTENDFGYSDELWVRTVYEFAASYHKSVISRDHVIQALAPLYRGKMYTFLLENRDATGEEVEARVEALCEIFQRMKPYLLDRWDGGK
jgi:glucosylglycerate synthase